LIVAAEIAGGKFLDTVGDDGELAEEFEAVLVS
jgi:hypothetical protein